MQAKYSVKDICIVALFSAIIFVMTVVPSIPIPLGYAHLGDAAIMLAGYYGGKKKGAIASALGSVMADFIGGYPLWIVPTLIIKYCMGRSAAVDAPFWSLRTLMGFSLSAICLVVGYTVAGAILYGGLEAGLSSTPGLIAEGAVNLVAAYAVGALLNKAGFAQLLK